MTSRSKNVNLNKEPFDGFVRHWKRTWVFYGDKNKEGDKGAFTLKLVKWVQTESRVSSGPARHPHICPVTDLSLVPGARIGSGNAAAAIAGKAHGMPDMAVMGAAAAAAAGHQATAFGGQMQQPAGLPPAAPTAAGQQQQHQGLQQQQNQPLQQQHMALAAGHPAAVPSAFAGAATAVAAAAAATGAAAADGGLSHATSLNALSVDLPSTSQQDAAGAAASAAGGSAGPVPSAFVLPSPSVVTGGMFDYSHPSGSQLQLQTTGSDFALYAAGAPSVGGGATASGYTAGTERTDSDALGRLPHAGGPGASEYTDSMDVDMEGGAGASQGGASQQRTGGASMDTAGDMDDDEFDEAGDEEDEEAECDGDDELDDGDDEGGDGDEDDGDDEEQGYEDDGLEDVADMP